jgi:solute carrier family 13 (sodium-dependent dicarboxylate transporter), member 2/3/5
MPQVNNQPSTLRRMLPLLIALAGFLLPFFVEFPGLSQAGHRLVSIFLLAVVLWVTEAIPLFATSAVVILLLVLTLSKSSADMMWGMPADFPKAPDFTAYTNSLADKVLILFLGGFFIAAGAEKYGLDRNLTSIMLKPFGKKPSRVLLGIMMITGILSMWMSNTATCATMMTVVLPIALRLDPDDRFRVALILGVPFAANLGGIGTPVGTPPNAIALGALKNGSCSFVQWMAFGIPLAIILLTAAWLVLITFCRAKTKEIDLTMRAKWDKSGKAWIYYATAAVTITLWMTEALHGINSYIVGLVPVAVLLSTRVINTADFREMEWNVLWLVAGGIALGSGVAFTGFDVWVVGLINWNAIPGYALATVLAISALGLGTFISHSAATNLLAPMSVAVSTSAGSNEVAMVVAVAIGSSMAMSLPISTPPNAIAFASGQIKTRDMALMGAIVSVVGVLLVTALLPILMRMAGIK